MGSDTPTELLVAVHPTPGRHAAAHRSRRAPQTSRRPGILLGALLAGGVAAAALGSSGTAGASAESTSVLAAQQQLVGAEEQLEVLPQASVSVAEAQARLQEVAASRAARAEAAAEAQAAAAEAEAAAAEAARPKTVMPIKGARLTSTFASRWGTFHYGIDLAAPMRTPEYAAADGVVLRAGSASGFGLAVYILHENGDVTVYGHMDKILVAPGDYVDAGETIALLGNRGQSTGPHLHFEVHKGGIDGKRIDPLVWLRGRGVDI
ncbi:M23 family metallopeptidase [Blastococcus aggregatus]|nr:M23 family metallopeptidase [Blastococcus aggregatus]